MYFFLMISFTVCQAQNLSKLVAQEQEADSLLAGRYYQDGEELSRRGQYDKAILSFKKAADLYGKTDMWSGYVKTFTTIGLNFAYIDQFDSSEFYLKTAKEVGLNRLDKNSIVLSDLYIMTGSVLGTIGRYREALASYQEALESREIIYGTDHFETAQVLHYMGVVLGAERNFIRAREFQERALKLFLEHYGNEHGRVADVYDELGSLWRFLGDLNRGIEYHEKALKIRLSVLGKEHQDMAYSYHHLGGLWYERSEFTKALSYFEKGLEVNLLHNGESHSVTASFNEIIGDAYMQLGNFEQARQYLEKALKARQKIFGSEHPETAKSFHALANLWFEKRDFEKSIFYYGKAANIRTSVYGVDHPIIASGYHNMGVALKEKGDNGQAEEYFKKALSISQQTEEPESTSLYQSTLGKLYMEKGDWRRALSHYQEALSAASIDFNPKDLWSNPMLDDILFPYEVLSALQLKGLALKKAYNEKKATVDAHDFLRESLNSTYLAIELMDKIQAGYQEEVSQQRFSEEHISTYANGISMAQTLFESTGERKYLSMAFEMAERSKAFNLSQNIKKQNNFALPDSLMVQERQLKTEIRFLEESLIQMTARKDRGEESQVEDLKDELFQRKRNLELLTQSFEQNYPAYYELKYQNNLIEVAQLQKALPENTGLIEYVWADSLLYVFTISPRYQSVKVLPMNGEFKNEIERFIHFNGDYQNALSKGGSTAQLREYSALSYKIFDHILSQQLDSLGKEIEALIIVPDGPLARLPFATLTVKEVDFIDGADDLKYSGLDYLIKKVSVRYAYSASLLLNHRPGLDRKIQGNFIGFAPRYSGKSRESDNVALRRADDEGMLIPLRFNEAEVENIAQITGGTVLLGEEATEMAFKKEAPEYSIVHIAAHGVVNDSLPDYSGIAFSTVTTEDTLNDGFLQSYELYNMKLSADLVVLSACETAVGQWQNGEGLISIARAFRYAGSQNILASQWTIDDENTAELMKLFYEKLKSGLQKDVALREAQLDFLETSVYSHPSFWGAYALWGDSEPIKWKESSDNGVIIYLSLIFLVIGTVIVIRRNNKPERDMPEVISTSEYS